MHGLPVPHNMWLCSSGQGNGPEIATVCWDGRRRSTLLLDKQCTERDSLVCSLLAWLPFSA